MPTFLQQSILPATLGLGCIFAIALLKFRKQSDGAFRAGLTLGIIGLFLGAAAAGAAVKMMGYSILRFDQQFVSVEDQMPYGNEGEFMRDGTPPPFTLPEGTPEGGEPHDELVSLIYKLNAFVADEKAALTSEQKQKLVPTLQGIHNCSQLRDVEARGMRAALLTYLNEDQRAQLDAFDVAKKVGELKVKYDPTARDAETGYNPFLEEKHAAQMKQLIDKL